jgi:hypothetical protein
MSVFLISFIAWFWLCAACWQQNQSARITPNRKELFPIIFKTLGFMRVAGPK